MRASRPERDLTPLGVNARNARSAVLMAGWLSAAVLLSATSALAQNNAPVPNGSPAAQPAKTVKPAVHPAAPAAPAPVAVKPAPVAIKPTTAPAAAKPVAAKTVPTATPVAAKPVATTALPATAPARPAVPAPVANRPAAAPAAASKTAPVTAAHPVAAAPVAVPGKPPVAGNAMARPTAPAGAAAPVMNAKNMIGPPVPPNLQNPALAGRPMANGRPADATLVSARPMTVTVPPVATPLMSGTSKSTLPAARIEDRIAYQYNALGRRDPFQPLIDGGFIGNDVGGDAAPDIGGIKVVGIVWGSDDKFALVEDARGRSFVLRTGDKVMNGVVTGLKRDAMQVDLTADGQTESVDIPLTRKGVN